MSGGLNALLPLLVPVIVLGIIVLRGARPRRVRVERLWIQPTIIMALAALIIPAQGAPSLVGLVLQILGVLVGAGLGLWRGRLTALSVHPETQEVTAQASTAGLALIGGIFLLRYGLRAYAGAHPETLHASATEVADAMLLLAVGLVCARGLEIYIRARALLSRP